ncbi:cytochrome c family protein [Desulfurispirillum indicum S5]|uniref:Cytochrome c family protein n=1 Tax=Desulfurispirillum indicum (strain ATCC BAA-1389 / DSM 22839 / S5) TaxID=653733 RepID=E6W2W8_DESIS|nr:tetrathionate reductase family octaheme c-type cytochrome [Desulfurispirillum indicum]ADU66793.1 cytochrome c family protein [Desulfurispirillum indicum S5]
MKRVLSVFSVFFFALALAGFASAGLDHSMFIQGEFKSGPEVTKKCLECHSQQGRDFMQTAHWKWAGKPNHVKGMESSKEEYGKRNMINNFCISVEGGTNPQNMASCTGCHAGYGWRDSSFDHSNPVNIDCLVCHTSEGDYFGAKRSGGAGTVSKAYVESGGLLKAAQSVGKPSMINCGTCHFYGGGGDAVKHGGLDSSLYTANRSLDVHMSAPANMTCVDCHTADKHRVKGASTMMATHEGRVSCSDCHADVHKSNPLMAKHLDAIACQTCHIPAHSRGQHSKVLWDWSTSGKKKDPEWEGDHDRETYYPTKGTFEWGKDVMPAYLWYNGQIERYMKGDKIDPKQMTSINKPVGDIKDKKAKIYPFKEHLGNQPYDTRHLYLLTPHTFQGYWSHLDWQKALVEGAKGAGMEYSGSFDFARTIEYISVSHQVAPKEQALKCADCHSPQGRLDWKALGYGSDPMTGGTSRNK